MPNQPYRSRTRWSLMVLMALAAPARAAAPPPPTPVQTSAAVEAPAIEAMPTVNGLYPLWEHTGEVHPWLGFQIGYQHAQLSLGRIQVGTQPVLDFYGTVNLQAKVALLRGGRVRMALEAGWYRIRTDAASHQIGNLNTVDLLNPQEPIMLLPVSLGVTWLAVRWLRVHASPTVLTQWSSGKGAHASVGVSALVELRASEHWAAMVHLGVEGVGVEVQEHAGLSLAYRHHHLDLRAGYARRFTQGESGNQFMVDAAVVF